MKPPKTALFCGIFSLLLLCAAAVRIGNAVHSNKELKNNFQSAASPERPLMMGYKSAEESPYIQGVPVEEIDFDYIRKRYIHTASDLSDSFYDFSFTYTLTDDITYYVMEDGAMTPALTVPKGTEVLWFCAGYNYNYDYGIWSYPTYQKGWRYAHPFRTPAELGLEQDIGKMYGTEADDLFSDVIAKQPYYYVRLNDLNKISRSILRQDEVRTTLLHNISPKEAADTFLFYWDDEYYRWGVFCSPDLQKDVWDMWDGILLAASAVFAVSAAGIVIHRKRKGSKAD